MGPGGTFDGTGGKFTRQGEKNGSLPEREFQFVGQAHPGRSNAGPCLRKDRRKGRTGDQEKSNTGGCRRGKGERGFFSDIGKRKVTGRRGDKIASKEGDCGPGQWSPLGTRAGSGAWANRGRQKTPDGGIARQKDGRGESWGSTFELGRLAKAPRGAPLRRSSR